MSATTHQSPLLWIPLKQTDEVDVATPVRSLISSSYGEDPKKYSSALASLARARTDAVRGAPGSDRTARDLLYKWFHILEMLEVRFPEIRVPFTWKDAFTNKPISQYSLAYEKASVIFNIGATLSAMASSTPRLGGSSAEGSAKAVSSQDSEPITAAAAIQASAAPSASEGDGTKRAYTALRQAAGFFTYINDNFLHAPSTDMSRPLLRFVVPLLLTQANEVFLEKTLGGKASAALLSKLASGVAQGYTTLAEESKEWITKETVDRIWGMLLQAKAKHYASLAQFHRAQADSAASNHGHSLVRLTMAENLSKEASKAAQQFAANHTSSGPSASASTTFGYTNHTSSAYTMPSDAGSSLSGLVSAHLATVSAARAQAVKDNDLIYHDILPSETALPAIDATTPAQLISIQEVYSSPEVQRAVGPDLFAKLVPLGVHERASLYSEEKAKLARGEAEKCDLAEQERVVTLDGMGLPAALEKYRMAVKESAGRDANGTWSALADPGTQVMTWSEEEAAGGAGMGADGLSSPGAAGVNEALRRINSLRDTANADLLAATESLDEEARLCEKARAKHGLNWSQEPSGGQARVKELRSEIKSNRDAFRKGEENDRRIETRWREVERDVELLIKGRGALEQAFAEALASTGSASRASASDAPSLLDLSESEEQASDNAVARLRTEVEAVDANLVKLSKVKRERDSLLAELREKLQSDDIGHLLILSHRGGSKNGGAGGDGEDAGSENPAQAAQEAALFRQELEKFRPWQQRLNQAVAAQAHLLSETSNLWHSITSSAEGSRIARQWDSKARGKEALVSRLGNARAASAEVRAALGKGLQFYEEAVEIARGLKASAREWNEQRARERQRLEGEAEWEGKLGGSTAKTGLESSFSNIGLGSAPRSSGASHPHLPPPERQSSYGYSPSPSPSLSQVGPPPPAPPANDSRYGSSYPQPPQQQHAYHAPPQPGLPPPPSQPAYSPYASGGPSQQSVQSPTSPYNFAYAASSGPFATGAQSQSVSSPPATPLSPPQRQGSYGYSPAPPTNNNNFGLSSAPYSGPAGRSPQPAATPSYHGQQYGSSNSSGASPYAGLPPPPPPSSGAYPSSSLPPPPPPIPQQHSQGYNYRQGAPPPPPPTQNHSYAGQYGSNGAAYDQSAAPVPNRYGAPPPALQSHQYQYQPPPPPSSQPQQQQHQYNYYQPGR